MTAEATAATRAEDISGDGANAPTRPLRRQDVFRELAWAALAAITSLLVAFWVYDLWDYPMRVPFARDGDGLAAQMIIRSVLDHGWVGHNPNIGAPFGSSLYDSVVSLGDATQLALAKLLGLFTSDVGLVMNALFLLGFPLAALTSYAVIRDLGFRHSLAVGGAVLFATTHYHFGRGTGHFFLGLAYAVPLACWLLFGVLGLVKLGTRRPAAQGWRAWLTVRTAITVVVAIIVGTSEIYYSVFALMLLAMLGPLVSFAQRSWRPLLLSAGLCALIATASVAAQAPQLLFQQNNGANTVSPRLPSESETFSLKLLDLLVPVQGHRLGALDQAGRTYRENTSIATEGANFGSLGTFAAIGLLGAWLVGLIQLVRGRPIADAKLLTSSGLLAGLAFAIATLGGLGAIFAFYISPQIRAWNRMSVVIAFFSIIAALWITRWLIERAQQRGVPAPVIGIATGLLFAFAVLDQAPSRAGAPYAGIESWRADYRFVRDIEKQLPEGGAILQLPYMAFPENGPINQMLDYQHLRLYVIGREDLRWSYGSSRNRLPEDWGAAVSQSLHPAAIARGAALAGFVGLALDRSAYADGGVSISRQLRSTLGPPLTTNGSNREFFDLRPLAADLKSSIPETERMAAKRELLDGGPVALFDPLSFYPEESDGTSTWRWSKTPAAIRITNPGKRAVRQILTTAIVTPGNGSEVTLTYPGGVKTIRTRRGEPTQVRITMLLPPGASEIVLTTDAPDNNADPRDLRVQLIDFNLADPALSGVVSPR